MRSFTNFKTMDITAKIASNNFITAFSNNQESDKVFMSEIEKKEVEKKLKENNFSNIKDTFEQSEELNQSRSKTNKNSKLISENKNSESGKPDELSDKEKQAVDDLKKRDSAVRNHEQAHLSAGGGLVKGGASYTYQIGPDGNRYAIGGEVQIDISSVPNDHNATIAKMQRVKAAAMAPSDPSSQDRAVAAKSSQLEAQARSESSSQNTKHALDSIKKYESNHKSNFSILI